MNFMPLARLFLILTMLLCSCSTPVIAQEKQEDPVLTDMLLTSSDQHLLLFARVNNANRPEIETSIRNGLPVTFQYFVELEAIRSLWFDNTLSSLEVTHTLLYDQLKQEYTVTFSEPGRIPQRFNTLEQAMGAMVSLNGLRVAERKELDEEKSYVLRARVRLSEKKLPLGMHYIVPFVSWWDIETEWRSIEFRY